MKKLTMLALATTMFSSSIFAGGIYLDANNDSTQINVAELNLVANPNEYIVTQYLGTDGLFNDGDRFTESVSFDIFTYVDPDLNVISLYDADIAGLIPGSDVLMTLTANVGGFVNNVNTDYSLMDPTWFVNGIDPSGGLTAAGFAALTSDADADGATDFEEAAYLATTFNINFDTGSISLLADNPNSDFANADITTEIGRWNVVSGIGDSVFPGTDSTDFSFKTEFDQSFYAANSAFLDSVWQDENGFSLFDNSDPLNFSVNFDTLLTNLAGPKGLVGAGIGTYSDNVDEQRYLEVLINDKGGEMVFAIPEPSSIAILGLGLLGLARIRRKA